MNIKDLLEANYLKKLEEWRQGKCLYEDVEYARELYERNNED